MSKLNTEAPVGYGDDGAKPQASNEALARIQEMIEQSMRMEKELEDAEAVVTAKRMALDKMQLDLIPSAMDSAGLKSFTTSSGVVVTLKEDILCSLAEDRKEPGLNWLEEKGHGAVIKRELGISLSNNQQELAKKLVEELSNLHPGLSVSMKRNVHPQTLKSLLKGLLESGVLIPDIFKVRPFRRATMK